MNINHCLILLALIFSFSNCIYLSEKDFKDIQFMNPTKFAINYTNTTYFRYKLDEKKEKVGLKFLKANSYTVNVTTFSSLENRDENKNQFPLAHNQFIEIDVSGFESDYLYIIIEMTKESYTYDDYLTIYDSSKPIPLEHNKVISINNFLSNNYYEFRLETKSKTVAFFYNTQNSNQNFRMITIKKNEESIYSEQTDSYNTIFDINENDNYAIKIENNVDKEKLTEKQEFTLMIREIENQKNHFNEIHLDKSETINYIYNKQSQTFYFYADITNIKELNTLNFKFDYRYYNKGNIIVLTKYVSLDHVVTQDDFDKNIPDKSESIQSYDIYSDEYFRIYLKNNQANEKYSYIFVSVEIKDESYYYGRRSIEYSIGEEEKKEDFTEIPYNEAQKIEKQTTCYIPYYWKLKLNKNDVYLLGIYNEHMFVSTFVKGDLISVNNTINLDILESNNEIIVLSDIEEFTIKLFGIKKNVEVYIERVRKEEIEFVQEIREKNKIFKLDMKKDQTKYILGTYSYDDYAFGKLSENYYITKDSGDFEVLYSNKVGDDANHLFPSNTTRYIQNFDKIIDLNTHLDLFTIKCKSDGIMYIRPEYKQFDYTVRSVKDNAKTDITMSELLEIAQLSAPLGKRDETLYFTINLVNNVNEDEISLTISPDEEGAFEKGTIIGNQIFKGSYDLSKYKLDELALLLNATAFATQLQIFEKIRDKYNLYKELNQGSNANLESYKNFYIIPNNTKNLTISIENLNGKKISYGIVKSPLNDINYNSIADEYPDPTTAEIKENIKEFTIDNTYENNTDTSNPFVIFFLSVLEQEKPLNYNLNISLDQMPKPEPQPTQAPDPDPSTTTAPEPEPQKSDNNTTKIVIIVVIIIVVVLIVVGIILFNIISKRRRSSNEIEKLGSIDSTENQLV